MQYGILDSGSMETEMITGSDNQTTRLDGLMSEMVYFVQVAGVNGKGVGEFRNMTVTTPASESTHTHTPHSTIATQYNSYTV